MSERLIGTMSIGIRAPIIKEGDDIVKITADSVLNACEAHGLTLNDKDIVAITESVVARAQGNYASIDEIANDVKARFGENATIGLIWPVISRNRFSMCLKGIAKGVKKIVLMLSLPADEMGNHLVSDEKYAEINNREDIDKIVYDGILTEEEYRRIFGYQVHQFTGVDYVTYYREVIESVGAEAEIVFSNDCTSIYKNYELDGVICADIHTRKLTESKLRRYFASNYSVAPDEKLCTLDSILHYHNGIEQKYGLLGSNKATEESVKLFPVNCNEIAYAIQKEIMDRSGKYVEVMIYGDGAFKDPVGKIWELADPVVAPGYTKGLCGTPNELKLKYLADNDFSNLSGNELKEAIEGRISQKSGSLVGKMESEGTTPRQIADLVGSLCDLTSGSGDKGTPIVLVKGYFDNLTSK